MSKSSLERHAVEFYQALSDLVRVYQFRDRALICYRDLSITQCYALSAIIRLGGTRLDTLAHELYLDKSTASRVVDSLERKGYSQRHSDPHDKRAIRIVATPKGERLHAHIESDLVQEHMQLLAELDPQTRKGAIRLVTKLAQMAQEKFVRQRSASGVTELSGRRVR